MKTKLLGFTGILCAGLLTATAADKQQLAGPKGGRLLDKTDPRAEFFVEKDHTAVITFYDASLKPVPVAEQTVALIADTKEGKQKIDFEKKGHVLVSKGKLPEGDGYNLVVQLRQKPDARPQNFRFKFENHVCEGCNRVEYACACHE